MCDRIEINPRVCNGNPLIRGTRIPVAVILDHLAADETWESLLEGFPELPREVMASNFEWVPGGVDNLNENSPPPVVTDANGRYPVPLPGQWVEVRKTKRSARVGAAQGKSNGALRGTK